MTSAHPSEHRLHALDALRAFALLLGVAFHAALSFVPGMPPGIWAANDSSPSPLLADFAVVSHIFRMSLFFFIAGYFGRLLYTKLGARDFWSNRATRIAVPLVIGWALLFPVISFVWSWGMARATGGAPSLIPRFPPGMFPLTHLWFLYLLLWIYVAALAARAIVARLDSTGRLRCFIDPLVTGSIRWGFATFTLGLPLAVALVAQPFWFYGAGIPTPDMSLVPLVPASVGYGTAFVFGWLVQRSSGALPAISRNWVFNLMVAVLATAWVLHVVHTQPMAQPGFTKILFACVFGVAVWAWVLGLTGAALRFLSNYSAARRYVADASYWVYLAHLPVVAALQVWAAKWPLHWAVKFPLILVASFALLFASYHILVRPTAIGQLLNGRRVKRGPGRKADALPATAPSLPASRAVSDAAPVQEPIALLRGVVKRYEKTTALAGVDLEVRPGELLAVLGPNGAGKSTAIALWLGIVEADEGEVRLLGGSPSDIERRRGLGVMMQDVELVKELRVRELVALAASYYTNPMTLEQVLAFTNTAALAGRTYGKLSGGQKRQVQFALAVVGRPRIVFLDEPTVGLDVQAREALWSSVRQLLADGCAVVLTTHYLEEAEALATRVAMLVKGRVIATGSVADMRALVARRQIRCESSLAPAVVGTWNGVLEAVHERDRLVITTNEVEDVVRRLLAADPGLKRLEVREAGLTEAFNELTREAA